MILSMLVREFELPWKCNEVQFFTNLFIVSFFCPVFRYQKKVSNIIDDVLEWSPKLAISGMIEKHTGANVTEASNYTSTVGTSHAPSSTEANPDTQADEGQDSEYDDDTIRSSKA